MSVFAGLPRGHYRAILADPPWRFETWSDKGRGRAAEQHYETAAMGDLAALPVREIAADASVLFLWATWPTIGRAFSLIEAWGWRYKTCAFCWMKTTATGKPFAGLGYWTRANTEPCLLATRGHPRRVHADVRQGIIEPRREHSRKPDCVYERIERLVPGPYLELFARNTRPGWDSWGNEVGKFAPVLPDGWRDQDAIRSYDVAIKEIGRRVKAGEPVPQFLLSEKK